MDFKLRENEKVLILWSGKQPPKDIESVVAQFNQMVGEKGKISLEHAERLHMCKFDTTEMQSIFLKII